MILKRLAIHRLPGIDEPFETELAGQGIQVIFGPNGIGKSSICRAVEGLYWEDRGSSRHTSVRGELDWQGEIWRAEREASSLRWCRGETANVSPGFPPSHNHHCFFLRLRDLIDPSRDSTTNIATVIRRQMSGGFDLERIASDLFSPVTRPRKRTARKHFNDARDGVQRAESRQDGLQKRVDQLEGLQSQLRGARDAERRLAHIERAIGLAKRRGELDGVREKLGKMPSALSRLRGTEHQDVDEYRSHLTELEKRARDLVEERDEARRKREESGLETPLDEADLEAWLSKANGLVRTEVELETLRTDLEGIRRKLDEASRALGGIDIGGISKAIGGADAVGATLSLPEQAELFAFLRDSHSHTTRVDVSRERLRLLEGLDPPKGGDRILEKFRSATEALRIWLRVPPPESFAVRTRKRWRWLALAFAMVAVGAGLVWLLDPWLTSVAAFGAGTGLAALFLDDSRDSVRRRREARTIYEEIGLDQPTAWDIPTVGSKLASLESERTELEASLKRSRDREVERRGLQNQLDALVKDRGRLDVRRQELRTALGLEDIPPDAELVDTARALDQLRLARGEFEETRGKVRHHERQYQAQLTKLANILERHEEPRPGDAAEAEARLHRLENRNRQLEQALSDERRAKGDLEENTADQNSARASITRIYSEAGLKDEDRQGLESLIEESLPRHRELTRKRAGLESQIELDRSELQKASESELADEYVQNLERLREEQKSIALQAENLRNEIADVTAEMKQAESGHDLQDLIGSREAARASLGNLREDALFREAGRFLVDEIKQEYEQTGMPRVFERTQQHFSVFTFGKYKVNIERGDGIPRLFAFDTVARQQRELDELSDGTRVQLLLAARMAFAEEVEQGKVLPLFLDEALDQSDPRRFAAIVRSLGQVAREQGRQIVYLTSDPLDVERIGQALRQEDMEMADPIDLHRLRTGQASVSDPEDIVVGPPPTIPSPEGLSSEEYAAEIGATNLRPARGSADQHVYYALWDDPQLPLLHDFLLNGIERAGQWSVVAGTPLAKRLGTRSIPAKQIGLRLDLLETFCELWNQGRGRPVDSDALRDSDILTRRYFDDVVAIARDIDGNAERLLKILTGRSDPRLRGFFKQTVERLRVYFAEHGFIDERPVLTESELTLHILATPAANELPSGFAKECARRWWRWASREAAPKT